MGAVWREASATKRAVTEAKAAELDAGIAGTEAATEAEIDAELAEHDKARSARVAAIPDAILAIYDELRGSHVSPAGPLQSSTSAAAQAAASSFPCWMRAE